MTPFTRSSAAIRLGLLIAQVSMVSAFQISEAAEPEFIHLDDCEKVSSVWREISRQSLLANCVQPNGSLSIGLVQRLNTSATKKICPLGTSKNQPRGGFECIQVIYDREVTEVLCIRRTEQSLLDDYKRNYLSKYSAAVSNYLTKAASCPDSNGDSAIAPETMFPMILAPIARPSFGFISSLGNTIPSNGLVLHGFGELDPTMASRQGSAVEYLYFLHGPKDQKAPSEDAYTNVGEWLFDVDEAEDFEEYVERQFQRQGMRTRVDYLFVDVYRRRAEIKGRDEKLDALESWQEFFVDELEYFGFRYISEPELRRETGKSYRQFRREAESQIPFGIRNGGYGRFGEKISVLLGEDHDCMSSGTGVLLAMVVNVIPDNFGASEYGNVGLILAGEGSCARYRVFREVEKSKNEIVSAFLDYMSEL